jgi:predicted dinucleotide-utilizing enzyme
MSGGVKYSIITDANGKLQSVQIYDLNGKKLKNKNYKVAINSYVGSKYKFKHNKFVMENPKTTALSLIDYIKKTKSIDQYSKLRRTEIKVK